MKANPMHLLDSLSNNDVTFFIGSSGSGVRGGVIASVW